MTPAPSFDRRRRAPRARADGQRGVVMWVALGVLVVMTLTGLAMLRQMGGGLSIAGNVAFKESATSLGDLGVETARKTVMAAAFDTNTNSATPGYYATWTASVDPTTWTFWNTVPASVDPATGNSVKWVVHRLCSMPGSFDPLLTAGQNCVTQGSRSPDRGVTPTPFTMTNIPFYRITAQVSGPRNTVSYTQVLMY